MFLIYINIDKWSGFIFYGIKFYKRLEDYEYSQDSVDIVLLIVSIIVGFVVQVEMGLI